MVILGFFLFFFLNQQSYVCAISSSLREGSTLFVALSSTGVAALIHSTVPVFLIIAVKKITDGFQTAHLCKYLHTLINTVTLAGGMTSALRLIRAPECASFNNFYS